MLTRATLYFDEVARRLSIHRASERLNIAPSAVDRQILQLEAKLGVPLFERLPRGLRLTAAGELLLVTVRRWRRDMQRVESQLDDLRGLRRGEISIAMAEGTAHFVTAVVKSFHARYPAIAFRLREAGSQSAVDLIMNGECEIGLTYNPPDSRTLRMERTLIYRLGVLVSASHPLAKQAEVKLIDCADYPLILPHESLALRDVIDREWNRLVGERARFLVEANSKELMKLMVSADLGIAILPSLDARDEIAAGSAVWLPLTDHKIPPSILSLVTASGRTLSGSASLLLQHISMAMEAEGAPGV